LTLILTMGMPTNAMALVGTGWSPFTSLTSLVLSVVLALIALIAPMMALVILGFKLEKLRLMLRLCVIVCIAAGVLLLLMNFVAVGPFQVVLGLLYLGIGALSYRMQLKWNKNTVL